MRETRVALMVAACEAFNEEGLDKPSLDAICARAGYTRGALYIHFKDREELIAAVVEFELTRVLSILATRGSPDEVASRLTEALTTGGLSALQLWNAAARSRQTNERLQDALYQISRRLGLTAGLNIGQTTTLITQALGTALLLALAKVRPPP